MDRSKAVVAAYSIVLFHLTQNAGYVSHVKNSIF
jgi:hypothetical protein